MATTRGPLFDGQAAFITRDMCRDMEKELGQHGTEMVRAQLSEVLRHPTGYYESHIRSEAVGGHIDVTDGGVVYGPWLEGVGSRNRTTRFKGYATFRRVTQALDRRAEELAQRVASRYIRRLG